jgi:cation transport regulator ChaC
MIAPAAAGALHIFGYGSLVWRHDELRHTSVVPARAHGWVRRFWQRSPDHRGTPAAPGRVVTLVPSADDAAVVHGALFTVAPQDAAEVLALLRHRERAGYVEQLIEVRAERQPLPQAPPQVSGGCTVRALVFYATPSNEHWAGPSASTEACAAAADEAAAAAIAVARGESGENIDYLTQLLHAMRARGIADEHLEALFVRASALRAVGLPPPPPP